MTPQNKPILEISQFGLADTVRADQNRKPGMCSVLLNTAPNLSGAGERIRRGYSAYTAVTAPTGAEILQVAPIQSPSQEDVHIWFASNSGQKIYMNPYWHDGTKSATNFQINEFASLGSKAVTFPSANKLKLTSPSGMNATVNYYKNWTMWNSTNSKIAQITAWDGTDTFTFNEDVDATGMNWSTTITIYLHRNFHSHSTVVQRDTAYNTTLADPPNVRSDESIIRLCGGQSSSTSNSPIWINPYLSRTFFGSSARPFTMTETYASNRKIAISSLAQALGITAGGNLLDTYNTAAAGNGLPIGKTYWFAIAPVYDGFQIGELVRFETAASYVQIAGGDWTNNYLESGATGNGAIGVYLQLPLGMIDKRITGYVMCAAQDNGDTSALGRQSEYFILSYVPISTTAIAPGMQGGWVWDGALGRYKVYYVIDLSLWNQKEGTYVLGSGIVEIPTDTMYNYSDESRLGQYHFLSNLYVSSQAVTNRQELFTNPVGGSAAAGNAGVVQPDMFSNEEGFYRIRVQPTVGSKINGMRILGVEDLLILKDRGVIQGRLIVTPENTVDFIWTVMSHDVGCATLKGHTFSDDGWAYFGGYDDIYRTRGSQIERLIESPDQNDWLYTYREVITKASKESLVCFYLPDRQVLFDIGQSSSVGKQVSYYPDYGWREVALNNTTAIVPQKFIKWHTRLQNGTVLVIDTSGNIYQWSNPTTGFFYSTDAGTAIYYKINTGDFTPSGDVAFDTILNYWAISRTFDSPTTGTLDLQLRKDGQVYRTYTGQATTSPMLRIQSIVSDNRIANNWGLVINSNTSSPETLNAGTILTINKLFLYGEIRPRGRKANEATSGTVGTVLGGGLNTIAGKMEITVNSSNTTGTFDIPFLKSYTGVEGAGIPQYRFEFEPPYVIGSDHSVVETVTIVSKSLTQIVLRSTSDNTLVKFYAVE